MKKVVFIIILASIFSSCDVLKHAQTEAEKYGVDLDDLTGVSSGLSTAEIVSGLKEALKLGTGNAVSLLNTKDGYLKDSNLKIPFPSEAQRVADKLKQLGMGTLVDNFEESLNRAAESAAADAKPIFVNAISGISFTDAKAILTGGEGAATGYFKDKTYQSLYNSFSPKIKISLDNIGVTKYWEQITSTYNKIPLVEKVNTDLTDYATKKALVGLFVKVEEEENKIRKEPAARVTDILKKVFAEQ